MVRILRRIDSETLVLPELKALIGKTVEITIRENVVPEIISGTGDWGAAVQAAQQLRESGYDFDVWRQQREYDLQHGDDHLL